MKHLFNKLSAFLVMLMCVSATVQAEIVHHTVCDPTASTLGFTQECWENTVTNKFYKNEACTLELTGAELAKAVVYAKLPSNPISGNSEFDVVEFDNTQTWGVNLNWAAETTFSNAYTAWSSTPRYAEFTVAGDNVEDARLVWMKNQQDVVNGRYLIKIYVKDAETHASTEVYSYTQTNNFEGVTIQNLKGLKNGDIVKFEVTQIAAATWHEAAPTFKACLEYTFGVARIIHHTPCEPTISTRGFTRECWEDTKTNRFYSNEACSQEITGEDLARAVDYVKLPKISFSDTNNFNICDEEDSGDFNWEVYTSIKSIREWISPYFAEFTPASDDIANARLVWKKTGGMDAGKFTIKIYVNGVETFSVTQQTTLEGVFVHPLPGFKKGDVVRLEIRQDAMATDENPTPFVYAKLEYTRTGNVIHHTPCQPTLSTIGCTRECWELEEEYFNDENCTQQITDEDLAKTVVYARLPKSPITHLDGQFFFGERDCETYRDVTFNWDAHAYLSYGAASLKSCYAEFTVKNENPSHARLVWSLDDEDKGLSNSMHTSYLYVNIYINDVEQYSLYVDGYERWNSNKAVFVFPLPGLNKNDVVKFEAIVNQGVKPGSYIVNLNSCLEYTYDCNHEYDGYECTICGYVREHDYIHHAASEPTLSAFGYSQDCWEDIDTNQLYSDEAHTQELTGADLAKTVIYSKLPESPISGTSDFIQSEHENDWSVDFNWAGITTFENAKTNLYETPRYVEFTVTNEDICNARLLWNRSHGDVSNGKYTVKIYVNDTETFSVDQNDDKNVEGVFVQPLPDLKQGDVVRFEVMQDAKATFEWDDPDPTFKACLEYNIPNIKILTANENPDEPGAYYSTYYDGQKAYTLIDGATAYTGTISDDNLLLTPIEDGIIPKGEAVIIRSNSGNITLLPSNSTKKKNEDNRLRGSDTDTEAPDGCYILSYGQHSLGFYRYAEGSILAAHKAFLIIQHGALAKAFRMVFSDGDVNAIQNVSANEISNSAIYNLNGVRLDKLQKGINIVGGKKIVVK